MKNKNILKVVGGFIGLIFIGAVGSGVWEKLLSPLWSYLIDKTIRFLSSIFSSFKDLIYFKASQGFHEEYSLVLLELFLGLMCGIFTSVLITRYMIRNDKVRDGITSLMLSSKEFILFNFLVLALLVTTLFIVIKEEYTNKITMKSINSIEIISPFIDIKTSQLLKSEFLSIKKAEDYNNFYKKMMELATKNNLDLPLFKPL